MRCAWAPRSGIPAIFAKSWPAASRLSASPHCPRRRNLTVPIAIPVHDGSGATAGVLVGSVLLSNPLLFGQFQDTKIGKTGWFIVISPKDRRIVAASDASRVMTTLPGHGVIPLLDRRLEEGYEGPGITVASIGVEVMTVARKMATTGWVINAAVPTAEVFAPIASTDRE